MNSKTLRSLSLGAIALSRQFGVRITVEQLEKKISQGQIKSEGTGCKSSALETKFENFN